MHNVCILILSISLLFSVLTFLTLILLIVTIKGTVSVISSDPFIKYDNVRFTMVHLKDLSDKVCLCFFKLFIFICGFSGKITSCLYKTMERLSELNTV